MCRHILKAIFLNSEKKDQNKTRDETQLAIYFHSLSEDLC